MTKKIFKSPWTYFIIILLIIGFIYGYKSIIAKPLASGQYDEFAQYLTEQGVKLYGTEWCPHCKNQKKLFGNSFQYIDYIDCDKQRSVCSAVDIRGYPTWNINNQNYPGEQSLERLAQLTGYGGKLE